MPTLLACLSHENTDIAADTIELLSELTGAGGYERIGVHYLTCASMSLFPQKLH